MNRALETYETNTKGQIFMLLKSQEKKTKNKMLGKKSLKNNGLKVSKLDEG